jgi:hypothetical protein
MLKPPPVFTPPWLGQYRWIPTDIKEDKVTAIDFAKGKGGKGSEKGEGRQYREGHGKYIRLSLSGQVKRDCRLSNLFEKAYGRCSRRVQRFGSTGHGNADSFAARLQYRV